MAKIDPVVGRVVWFHPPSNSTHSGFAPNAVCAATIAKVLPDGKLNLGVLDGNGVNSSMTEVPLIQDGDALPENGYYAEWVPTDGKPRKVPEPSPFSAAANPVTTGALNT
jgi:hypothetical protein